MEKPKVIVIVGPTASGKTSLSIDLAKKLNGEIVSCDSMQIYKYMDIGTAKPTIQEQKEIKHHLIDIISPEERFNVSDYQIHAQKAIDEILEKGKVPIVVGGTGLYVNSLIYGIKFLDVEFDEKYRKTLEERVEKEGLENLYNEAQKIDPKAMENISKNDKKRILRVLEIFHKTGITKSKQDELSRSQDVKYDFKVFAINIERELLYNRINDRVDEMIENGLIEEVENIYKKFKKFPTSMQAIGYKEVVEYLNKNISKEEMIEKIKMETRRYAKRQLTWFRKNKDIIWLDGLANRQNNIEIILEEYSGKEKQESNEK